MSKAVFCIAQSTEQAESIVNDLNAAGFPTVTYQFCFPTNPPPRILRMKSTPNLRKGLLLVGQWV